MCLVFISFLFYLQSGGTPLIEASYYGKLDLISPLLLCGANVNAQDKVNVCMYVWNLNVIIACHCSLGEREIRVNWCAYWYWSRCVLHCGWCGIVSRQAYLFLGKAVNWAPTWEWPSLPVYTFPSIVLIVHSTILHMQSFEARSI